MADKYYKYVGFTGWLHDARDSLRVKWEEWKSYKFSELLVNVKNSCSSQDRQQQTEVEAQEEYSHLYRRKTRRELLRISAAVMGIEFSYAAETAFVSPTLLKIGVQHQHMTLVWALSPLIGFFLTPILGSLSDRCSLPTGRRRPFIFMMSLGVLLGLILVPNGEYLGYVMGDQEAQSNSSYTFHIDDVNAVLNSSVVGLQARQNADGLPSPKTEYHDNPHPWGVFFTILGTVLLDFDADACQSPARAFLLDVTTPDDHARGLSTFTVMAGLGGFLGYALGGIDWDVTFIGTLLGGHVRAVFTLITIIFIVCVSYTITSFKEMPLYLLESQSDEYIEKSHKKTEEDIIEMETDMKYGTLSTIQEKQEDDSETYSVIDDMESHGSKIFRKKSIVPSPNASFMIYLKSIIYMPHSIRMVCLTNLFCWMAHVCYSLYFTDFVGEAVFNGDPTEHLHNKPVLTRYFLHLNKHAPIEDVRRQLYESGIRFGCWGMSMYSLSCSCYSMIIEKLIQKAGARNVYVGGLLVYSSGMLLMALTKQKFGVILFSWTAGVMYSTLFTMPYLLIAHYHARGVFELTKAGDAKINDQIRGLGTDVAIVSSMVFLAQFILSMCMGTIVNLSGTTTAVVSVASFLAFIGALTATRVMYLDL